MSSIATALFGLGMAFGNLLVGLIVNIVNVMSAINFLYFLVCCWVYGPCEGERTRVMNNERGNMSKKQ
ncbi:hypothetical protein IFM89_010052 [Coptis chinensis]|uniref:Uncharacterized protein n=1 Tax=Coptis chinensis TaxID=261450 RepID=A0A835LV28_9MAGN|nr:hypothetical protein IFM89_010052 [Coptis chinensis]